jgi:membrane dipeptidase
MKKIRELSKEEVLRADEIHKKSIVIDMCNVAQPFHPFVVNGKLFEMMHKGGETCGNITLVDSQANLKESMSSLADWHYIFQKNTQVILASSADDILRAKRTGKVAVMGAFQNGTPLEDDVDLLLLYHKLGIRVFQPTYNTANLLGNGCLERTDGLTNLGVKAVEAVNHLHMLLDLSHCGTKTTKEALEISKDPVLYTHANPRAICESERNKADEEIKALAEKEGVIGLTSYSPFAYSKLGVRPTIEDYMKFVDYTVKLVGVDYVGIGTDIADAYVGVAEAFERQKHRYPKIFAPWTAESERMEGLDHVYLYPNVTKGLVAHGYSDQEIQKILGLNFLRVIKRVCGK